ncbi:MAG: hypothetical protein LBU64_14220 [Planctomycetota bacterium]|nr:hypothetical protein [Planctomycetota bacterium]
MNDFTDGEEGVRFSLETMTAWREGVGKRREELFRRSWKNQRPNPNLKSRQQEKTFQFVVEWCEEFGDVVARERERSRLDKLKAPAKAAKGEHK